MRSISRVQVKSNGKTRLLGIPTAIDRVYQQALHQVLQPIFEVDFQISLLNRRIRDPYVRWCERRTPAILVGAIYSIGGSFC